MDTKKSLKETKHNTKTKTRKYHENKVSTTKTAPNQF
jgi:hypothetical protein